MHSTMGRAQAVESQLCPPAAVSPGANRFTPESQFPLKGPGIPPRVLEMKRQQCGSATLSAFLTRGDAHSPPFSQHGWAMGDQVLGIFQGKMSPERPCRQDGFSTSQNMLQ